jgi:hypothetical protein
VPSRRELRCDLLGEIIVAQIGRRYGGRVSAVCSVMIGDIPL